jgi:lipoprotein NlpD
VTARLATLLLLLAVGLAGCGQSRVVKREGSAPAPRTSAQAVPRGGSYQVRAGDTLYGIAFRHGLDYREVAAWNRIPAPFTIYPGQRLSLVAPAAASSRPAPTSASAVRRPPPTSRSSTPAAAPAAAPAAQAPVATPSRPPAAVPSGPAVPATVAPGGWRWPTQGQLIGRFVAGDPKRQGIDIAGTAGQAVVAAADGVVVYSGAGLVGYGELIIIKHSDEWLSAYAHNRKRLVAEGVAVKGGQPIAELGRTGTSRDMLHFEVRRNGKPVDPLQVLPPL